MGLIEKMFESKAVRALGELRLAELEKFRWLAGEWTYENPVPATRVSPAYCDVGVARFAPSDDGA